MKQAAIIATRAGAGLPPAFVWEPGALATAGALLALLAAAAPARAALPDSARWGWGMRADSVSAPAVRDSVPTGPGQAPNLSAPLDQPIPYCPPTPAMIRGFARIDSLRRARVAGSDSSLLAQPSRRDSIALARRDSLSRYLAGNSGPFEYLWVVRTAILSPADVDRVVARAKAERVRGLLVQVIGRGDAFYRSDRLPRAEALPRGDFDPFERLVRAAHAEGIEVHAWINCMLVWSAPQPPRDPRHVVRQHPEWIARLEDGRALHRLTPRQRERLGLEGVFLAPAHPGVRTWVAENAKEIVARYAVDGIHLDYIRQPVAAVGWDPTTRARFALEAEVDPARFGRLARSERARVDSLWLRFQCEQLRATVSEVRDSVHALEPGLPISAAVIADTLTAERHNAQRWRDWLRSGLLDRAFVMCYAQPVQTVLDQLLGVVNSLGAGGRVVPGIAVYNSPPATAAAKLKGARALGFPAVAVYSYDALEGRPGYWGRLRELVRTLP